MEEYVSKVISNTITNDKPVLEKVVKTSAVKVKKSLLKRTSNLIFGEQGFRGVMIYVFTDIVAPAIKDMIYDGITNGTRRIIYGSNDRVVVRGRNYSNVKHDPIRYNKYDQPRHSNNRIGRLSNILVDYELHDRNEALDVIDRMKDYLSRYNFITIGDYYDLIGIDSQWTDRKYGWRDLSGTTISKSPNGYIINFPMIEEE